MNLRSQNNSGQRNHVLILDDEEGARLLLSRIAQEAGYEVSVAANSDEFIHQFSINKPTFLVLDVFLGNENVETIFRFLRNQRYSEPVALVSGYAVREMDSLVADALGKGILIAGLFEKNSMVTSLRKQLDVYHRGARVA